MWEPAVPAGLWAAPGEGKAASSAPASSHLVNTINNVISAPRTSLWRAGREFTELQLGTGLETPKAAPKANPALGATGLEGTEPAPSTPSSTQGSFHIDSLCQLQPGSAKIYDGHHGSVREWMIFLPDSITQGSCQHRAVGLTLRGGGTGGWGHCQPAGDNSLGSLLN